VTGLENTARRALDEFLTTHLDELVVLRRHLHAHPEASREEHETTAMVADRLRDAGLHPRRLSSGTGLWCDVGGAVPAGSGRTIAVRADLDALRMPDEKSVPYRSQRPGLAHACGHDVHTTIVLGAGLALASLANTGALAGTVRLVFQPGEEVVPGGALDVLADGGLDAVDAIFGLHCDPKFDAGTVGVRPGPITSAANEVRITLHGPGGHTARPQLTADLVALVGRIVTELPARVAEIDGALLLVFGSVHAGDAANVIPTSAVIAGTLRTPDRDAWDGAQDLVERLLADLAADTPATAELEYVRGAPPVVNDEELTTLFARVAASELGPEHVVEVPQSAGGDDFSWYLERVPGCYWRLGVHDPESGHPRIDLHTGNFDVDERAIGVGIRVLTRVVLNAATLRSSP
jgi:amidohydrolase